MSPTRGVGFAGRVGGDPHLRKGPDRLVAARRDVWLQPISKLSSRNLEHGETCDERHRSDHDQIHQTAGVDDQLAADEPLSDHGHGPRRQRNKDNASCRGQSTGVQEIERAIVGATIPAIAAENDR